MPASTTDRPTRSTTDPLSARPPLPPGLVLGLSVLALGTGSIFARLADAPAPSVAFWRCAIATAVLIPLAGRGLLRELNDLGNQARRAVVGSLVAGSFLAVHFATWIASLDYTSVAASALLVNTSPMWVAILGPLVIRDRASRLAMIGIALTLAGTVVIGGGDLLGGEDALLGDALAFAGAIAAALYLIVGRRVRSGLSLRSYTLLCYGSAAVLLLLWALVAGALLGGYAPETWGWIAALALVPQLIGHSAFNWALRWATPTLVAVSMSGEPIVATLLAWSVLDELPPGGVFAGGALVLVGIALAARGEAVQASADSVAR